MYENLPPEYRPLSPWAYFGLGILYTLPLVGWVFLVIHAIGAPNINKRNYARSFFCVYVVAIVLTIVGVSTGLLYSWASY